MMNKICPITGVNRPRLLLSFAAGFAFIFIFDFIVHSQLLMPLYLETPQLWRTPADMQAHFGWMAMTQAFLAFISAFIFTRNFEGKGIAEGVRFGLMIGLLLGVSMAGSYAWSPISLTLALSWLAAGTAMGLGLGVIYSLTYRR